MECSIRYFRTIWEVSSEKSGEVAVSSLLAAGAGSVGVAGFAGPLDAMREQHAKSTEVARDTAKALRAEEPQRLRHSALAEEGPRRLILAGLQEESVVALMAGVSEQNGLRDIR